MTTSNCQRSSRSSSLGKRPRSAPRQKLSKALKPRRPPRRRARRDTPWSFCRGASRHSAVLGNRRPRSGWAAACSPSSSTARSSGSPSFSDDMIPRHLVPRSFAPPPTHVGPSPVMQTFFSAGNVAGGGRSHRARRPGTARGLGKMVGGVAFPGELRSGLAGGSGAGEYSESWPDHLIDGSTNLALTPPMPRATRQTAAGPAADGDPRCHALESVQCFLPVLLISLGRAARADGGSAAPVRLVHRLEYQRHRTRLAASGAHRRHQLRRHAREERPVPECDRFPDRYGHPDDRAEVAPASGPVRDARGRQHQAGSSPAGR